MSHIDATIVAPPGAETEAPGAPPVQTVIEGAPGAPQASAAAPAKVYNAKAGADSIDFMRVRRDSAVGRLNAALSFDVAKTVKQLALESNCATAAAHLSWALKRAFVIRTAPSTYLRAPHTREEAPPADSNGAAVAPPVVETEAPPAEAPAPVKETASEKKARKAREKREAAAAEKLARETAAKAPPVVDETALVETGAETQVA